MFMLSHQCNAACRVLRNCGILQSRNGEHGESFEDVENMEKKKKMESILIKELKPDELTYFIYDFIHSIHDSKQTICQTDQSKTLFYSIYRDS